MRAHPSWRIGSKWRTLERELRARRGSTPPRPRDRGTDLPSDRRRAPAAAADVDRSPRRFPTRASSSSRPGPRRGHTQPRSSPSEWLRSFELTVDHESCPLLSVRAAEVLRLEDVEKPVPGRRTSRQDPRHDGEPDGHGLSQREYCPARVFTGFLRPKQGILGNEFAGEVETVGTAVSELGSATASLGFGMARTPNSSACARAASLRTCRKA